MAIEDSLKLDAKVWTWIIVIIIALIIIYCVAKSANRDGYSGANNMLYPLVEDALPPNCHVVCDSPHGDEEGMVDGKEGYVGWSCGRNCRYNRWGRWGAYNPYWYYRNFYWW